MARYGREYNPFSTSQLRPRSGRRYGGDFEGRYGAEYRELRRGSAGGTADRGGAYGGMRSDAYRTAYDFERFSRRGRGYSGFGTGGGSYDMDYDSGRQREYAGGYDRSYIGSQRGGQVQRSRGQRGGDADRVRASAVMTDNPEVVTPDTKVTDVAKKMRDINIGIIPVVDDEDTRRLRGVVTDRDLAVRVLAEGKDGNEKVSTCMTEEVETVNQNDTIHQVLDVMKREQVRRVPVTDRDGRLVGIIAQADLAVDYAGFDLQRETEVQEAIERISEPARPERGRGG